MLLGPMLLYLGKKDLLGEFGAHIFVIAIVHVAICIWIVILGPDWSLSPVMSL